MILCSRQSSSICALFPSPEVVSCQGSFSERPRLRVGQLATHLEQSCRRAYLKAGWLKRSELQWLLPCSPEWELAHLKACLEVFSPWSSLDWSYWRCQPDVSSLTATLRWRLGKHCTLCCLEAAHRCWTNLQWRSVDSTSIPPCWRNECCHCSR